MMNLVNKIQEFFFGNEVLAKTFEDFVRDKSAIIDLSSEEYRLEYTEAYNEYKNLFESKLEHYIEVWKIISFASNSTFSFLF